MVTIGDGLEVVSAAAATEESRFNFIVVDVDSKDNTGNSDPLAKGAAAV